MSNTIQIPSNNKHDSLGLHRMDSHVLAVRNTKKRSNKGNIPSSFSQQKVKLSNTPFLFFPRGLENIALLIYAIFLPYVVGIIFIFTYVANGKSELFSYLNTQSSYILTWAIGYEILAFLGLLYIVKNAIMFAKESSSKQHKPLQIP